jgi:hypothetical protein
MSPKSVPVPIEPPAAFDEETTRPIPLQLIARLAANDPTVQLKIGVVEAVLEETPADPEKKSSSD